MITLKSEREIDLMRKAGQAVALLLDEMEKMVRPGISTKELDKYAESRCKELGVIPVFKGYHGFPASVCISVNEQIVHGIPSSKKILKEGDIVGLDFGVSYEGWFGDSARTVPVGKINAVAQKLMDATKKSLHLGIEQCFEGNRVFDIGYAVQNYVESLGYSVVREFVGHGIGRALHEDPQVPNFGARGKGIPLKVGMVLAIEPMVNIGGPEVVVLDDGWTAVTKDKSLSAHFEHTVAITPAGPEILTLAKTE
ncbi:type I methionyl aminopeptidase [bacterium]|jgi:methionyl aminopeptidase|nr:type I methionyl aminopeptidase [bacterium]